MRRLWAVAGQASFGVLALVSLYLISRGNYLLFHSFVELFSVVILSSICLLVWNSARFLDNRYLMFLGAAFPAVGVLNMLHLLAYRGMGVFDQHHANAATQLWVAQRALTAAAFLLAPLAFGLRPLGRRYLVGAALILFSVAAALLLAAIFAWHNFPDCFIEEVGLTPFKKISEIVIAALFLLAIPSVLRRRAHFERGVLKLVVAAIALSASSELCFILYTDPTGISNMLGHLINVVSFTLIYKAIVVTGITRPQSLLFRELTVSEEALRGSEQRYRLLAERLQQMNRSKDTFMAMLGHELRNPLSPILNSLYVLKLRTEEGGESSPRYLEIIERQVQHMARLVDELLDVTRITKGKIELHKERVDLAVIIRHAAESCQPLFSTRGHELFVQLPPEPLILHADPARMEQVLVNLLNNAAKYTENGGQVWLEAQGRDGEAALTVRDNGTGLTSELLSEIFEPFSQAERTLDRSQGGLGLGLTLVRGLVELHGGSVQAHSAGLGQGSEFLVRLPLADGDAEPEPGPAPELSASSPEPAPSPEPAEAAEPAMAAAPAGPLRVLVVEDNLDSATLMRELLTAWGHQSAVIHQGGQALEAALAFRPDVVLLDIGLPDQDGYTVARQLRGESSLGPLLIVAITGYGQREDMSRSHQVGIDHHLPKPVNLRELRGLLSRHAGELCPRV